MNIKSKLLRRGLRITTCFSLVTIATFFYVFYQYLINKEPLNWYVFAVTLICCCISILFAICTFSNFKKVEDADLFSELFILIYSMMGFSGASIFYYLGIHAGVLINKQQDLISGAIAIGLLLWIFLITRYPKVVIVTILSWIAEIFKWIFKILCTCIVGFVKLIFCLLQKIYTSIKKIYAKNDVTKFVVGIFSITIMLFVFSLLLISLSYRVDYEGIKNTQTLFLALGTITVLIASVIFAKKVIWNSLVKEENKNRFEKLYFSIVGFAFFASSYYSSHTLIATGRRGNDFLDDILLFFATITFVLIFGTIFNNLIFKNLLKIYKKLFTKRKASQ